MKSPALGRADISAIAQLRSAATFTIPKTPKACRVTPCKPLIHIWCPEPGSNRHVQRTRDFKSLASTNFAIGAVAPRQGIYTSRPHEASTQVLQMAQDVTFSVKRKISVNHEATKPACDAGGGSRSASLAGTQLTISSWTRRLPCFSPGCAGNEPVRLLPGAGLCVAGCGAVSPGCRA